ncbi:MAG: hypothetical protein SCALA702_16970 [Melioribacteraceae bacterium]|nr:MAG: hypothetical protein SCALA702_16970 [Melioribacteraceae bacterium]
MYENLNILVCDDDSADLKLFKIHLNNSSLNNPTLFTALNQDEIEQYIAEHKDEIDIVFLDYNMPGKTGIQWLAEMKSLNFAPVVMLTGSGDEEIAVDCMKLGAYSYITKQKFDSFSLSKVIMSTLDKWELEKERKSLLGIAAHELRTPLTTILGYTRLLKDFDEIDAEKRHEILDIIHERAEYQLGVINKLLNITRIDEGTINLNKEIKDIVFFVRRKVHEANLKAKAKEIAIKVITSVPYLEISYDPERLDEVLSNLLDNAIKFSSKSTEIVVELTVSDDQLKVSVQDQGQGIKEEELKYLFKMFSNVKVSSQPTAGEESSGLGLAICKKIVRLHEGTISVQSKINVGTIFTVSLPIDQ